MSDVANARINNLPSHVMQTDFVPPDDPILEIPLSELQGLLNEMVLTHNLIAETVRDAGILRGRELARMVTRASDSLKATRSPIEKLQLINAYVRQLLTKIREALKSRPAEGGLPQDQENQTNQDQRTQQGSDPPVRAGLRPGVS